MSAADQFNFYDLTLSELKGVLTGFGKESFRASQLFKWVYQKRVCKFDQMSDISKSFRFELPRLFHFHEPSLATRVRSSDGTEKFLIQMGPDEFVECVLIPAGEGRLTLCLSSEIGCNLNCAFCYTAQLKLKRRLTPGEIVSQFLIVSELISERITNIVFMGMGEPLDNADHVFKAIEIFNESLGIGLSRRKITLSTSGIVPHIHRVTDARIRLAVSLNGANDEVRSRLMPINRRWPLKTLMEACAKHAQISGDKVTFAYVLIDGLTDSRKDAEELVRVTRSVPCKINIIPFNPFPGSDFKRPSDHHVMEFHKWLQDLGAHVLYRKSKGQDILAACGQLNATHSASTGSGFGEQVQTIGSV